MSRCKQKGCSEIAGAGLRCPRQETTDLRDEAPILSGQTGRLFPYHLKAGSGG